MGFKMSSRRLSVVAEGELVRAAQAGDATALERLFEAHYEMMYRQALRFTRDEERASDVLQESCIKVMHSIAEFRGEARFSSWMSTIVANTAHSYFRAERRFVPLQDDIVDRQVCIKPSPETLVNNRQRLRLAVDCLRQGRIGDYQLFVRRYVVGQSVSSISRDMGLSVPTVKTRVHRARERLKQSIDA
jgi:RNA polymerase sigma-70 factor (ECF subfamily)